MSGYLPRVLCLRSLPGRTLLSSNSFSCPHNTNHSNGVVRSADHSSDYEPRPTPTEYLGPLWAKTGRPLYSPGPDEARTLPGPNRSALSVPRHAFELHLRQALTLPGGTPPTLVPESGAVLRPRMEGRSRFKINKAPLPKPTSNTAPPRFFPHTTI